MLEIKEFSSKRIIFSDGVKEYKYVTTDENQSFDRNVIEEILGIKIPNDKFVEEEKDDSVSK